MQDIQFATDWYNEQLVGLDSRFQKQVKIQINSLKKGIEHRLFSLKDRRLNTIIFSAKENLKTADPFENEDVFKYLIQLEIQKKRVNKILGRTIIK